MGLRQVFDSLLNYWNSAEFEVGKTWNFVRDFYYFNSELLSFFVLNILFLLYFLTRNAVSISMEVRDPKQIVLHSLARNVRDVDARTALHEEINRATSPRAMNALLERLAPQGDLEELKVVLQEDNEVVRLKRAVDDWNGSGDRLKLVLAMCGVVVVYLALIMFVWYYSYLSQSVTFLFLLMTLNTIFLVAIDDPVSNHEETLIPTLRDLKRENIYIQSLVINGTELYQIEKKADKDIYEQIRAVTISGGNVEEKRKRIREIFEETYHNVASRASREEVIQDAIKNIDNTNYHRWLWRALAANYMWRLYNLIGGYSTHLSLQHRLHI